MIPVFEFSENKVLVYKFLAVTKKKMALEGLGPFVDIQIRIPEYRRFWVILAGKVQFDGLSLVY